MITQKNHWKFRWVLLAIGLCLLVSVAVRYVEARTGPVERTEQAVTEEPVAESETPVADIVADAPDAIPDGTAQELLEYVNRQLGSGLPVPDNDAERAAQVEKLERSLKAINMGLERVDNDELNTKLDEMQQALKNKNLLPELPLAPSPRIDLRTELLQNKSFVLQLLNDYAEGYTTIYLDYIAELEANPADREVAKNARGRYLEGIGNDLASRKKMTITREAFFEYQKQVVDFLRDNDSFIQLLALNMLSAAIKLADQENDRAIVLETADLCASLFENSKDEFNHRFAYRPHAIVNKHYLAVDGLQIQGKLFNDETFDIAAYRGRPMLVVFWRSDPDVEENLFSPAHASHLVFPRLKEIYNEYHDRGLEIVGVCTDAKYEEGFSLQTAMEHSRKTAETLPWQANISEKLTTDAGLPSNEKKYDLFGEYIFFLDAEGRVRHQQGPNCADLDSAIAKGVNITGMMRGPMKYLTAELEQKIKDCFSGMEVKFYIGKRETVDGDEKIVAETFDDFYRVEGEQRFVALEIANCSGCDLHDVELVIHAPTLRNMVSDAVKIIVPELSGIEKTGDAYRLKIDSLPSQQDGESAGKSTATMILEFEICHTDRYLHLAAEVLEEGEQYGRYEILLEVKQAKAE